jgi:hypothetical protein
VLISDAAPPFLTYYAAASCVFNLANPIGGGRGVGAPTYRHQDKRGRINRVQIVEHSEFVRIELEGSALDGAVVELGGNVPGPLAQLNGDSNQSVDLPIQGGLPNDAFVVLRIGGQWLDRRVLARTYPRASEPGVEYVVESTTRLQAFIAAREGPESEFKVQIPAPGADEEILRSMKSVAAFTNGTGGVILYGVNNKEEVVGIENRDLDRIKSRLTSLAGEWVNPRPGVTFEEFEVDGRPDLVVLGMSVAMGNEVPYGAGKPGQTQLVYLRNYSQSVPARPHEIRAIVQSRLPADGGGPFGKMFQ